MKSLGEVSILTRAGEVVARLPARFECACGALTEERRSTVEGIHIEWWACPRCSAAFEVRVG